MKRKEFSWQLPEKIVHRLGDTSYGRQRAIFEDDHLLIILHLPPVNGGAEKSGLSAYPRREMVV